MAKYSPKLRAEIKLLFVQHGKSALEISKQYGGKPTAQAVLNWSRELNKEGVSWEDERDEYQQREYEKLSPQSQADKILKRIDLLLQKSPKSFTTKDADALAKLQKVMEKLVDKKFQIPTMYHVLTRLLEFISLNYKSLLGDELINAIRHFKNQLKEELE